MQLQVGAIAPLNTISRDSRQLGKKVPSRVLSQLRPAKQEICLPCSAPAKSKEHTANFRERKTKTMEPRVNFTKYAPEAAHSLFSLEGYLKKSSLGETLIHVVKMRA
jgi:hypothetical protein